MTAKKGIRPQGRGKAGAPKGNTNAVGNRGGGRPSAYKAEYAAMAGKIALLGATDAELATIFEVCEKTINEWKKAHVEFYTALKEGKDQANAVVADSLFHRAKGYSHPEEKVFCQNGEVTRVETVKHYPPDPTSMIFWLKNRRPDLWRDMKEHKVEGAVQHRHEMSRDELLRIASEGRGSPKLLTH